MYKIAESFLIFVVLLSSCRCRVLTDNWHTAYGNSILDEDMENISDEEMALQRFNFIYPGTKWCGAGNIAEDYDDLGTARETDMCCREHDNCPDLILSGESKYNLTNDAYYTRLSCECDNKFNQCLRRANSSVANKIGKIYFNGLGTKCYRTDYPTTGCKLYGGWFKRKCVEHTYDTDSAQLFQWFHVPDY